MSEKYDNRLIYAETMSFACSVERFAALNRLAFAAQAKEDAREAFGTSDAGRALWLDAYAEFQAALAALKETR
jgi:hypothetical protein